MTTPDMHQEEFDEGTAVKLHIFRQYLTSWIPVFPLSGSRLIQICDYFAGPGQDAQGSPGSPLIAVDLIDAHRGTLLKSRAKVILRLNDIDRDKADRLKLAIDGAIDEKTLRGLVEAKITAQDFNELHRNEIDGIRRAEVPSFVFIDQYGIKYVTEEVFAAMCKLEKTDFMFFVSSSFFKRFAEREEFAQYHPKLNKDEIKASKQAHVHRRIRDYYQSLVPAGCSERVYSFTIQKNKNIYGLIFCTAHPLGAEKFINVAWKENGQNGEANFDIDDDEGAAQEFLFSDKRLTKKESFEKRLRHRTVAQESITNKDVYNFCLAEGMQPSFGKELIKKMIDSKIIFGPKQFGMTCQSIYREGNVTSFKRL